MCVHVLACISKMLWHIYVKIIIIIIIIIITVNY